MRKPTCCAAARGGFEEDRSIRCKQEQRLIADLDKLTERVGKGRLVREQTIGEVIGRLKERYPRVAPYYQLRYDPEHKKFTYSVDGEKYTHAETLDGIYLLRADRTDLDAEQAWRFYILLTRAEDAFRDMKSPLSGRPIFHHLERRVETHIFLCVLAYHLLVAVENTLLHNAVHTSWRTVRETLETHHSRCAGGQRKPGAPSRRLASHGSARCSPGKHGTAGH